MDIEQNINSYKRKFDQDLRQVKVVMMQKKSTMTKSTWIRFVMTTRRSILSSPSKYLKEVPEMPVLKAAIDKVFQGFLNDQKIRDAQKRL